jgi:hypothetical protein
MKTKTQVRMANNAAEIIIINLANKLLQPNHSVVLCFFKWQTFIFINKRTVILVYVTAKVVPM